MYVYMYKGIYVCLYVCMYVYMCILVFMYKRTLLLFLAMLRQCFFQLPMT